MVHMKLLVKGGSGREGGGGEERATTLTRSPKAGKLLIEASLLDLSAVRCIKLLMTIELDLDFYAPQRQYYAIWL